MRRMKLEDLPAGLQDQVRRKLQLEATRETAPIRPCTGLEAGKGINTHGGDGKRNTTRLGAGKQPNKTEAEYNRKFLGGSGKYEGITLRLPGGSRYTPDWASVDGEGRITLHEVKGSYRHHSQGRALTAFREAAAAFPEFGFVWAARQRDGTWEVVQHA